ncbi:MAG: ChrR family anti-sigma-E factor [Pseudomonadota bacterium]|nr:ChrR family anti-sigma-E factor [Pseudomonadota bacterium]
MIRHHPDEALLLALAAGTLPRGPDVVAAAHTERCAHCQARLRDLDALGGALLEDAEPAVLAPEALAGTLARIDAPAPPAVSARALRTAAIDPPARLQASLPDGTTWPRSLRGASSTRWRWLGPGMRWSRVTLADDRAANVFLLRIAAGKCLPVHSHRGVELTQVLYGAFHDGRARFAAGDFDEADDNVLHQPVVEAGGECICLASVEGRVAFEGRIARMLGALVGM